MLGDRRRGLSGLGCRKTGPPCRKNALLMPLSTSYSSLEAISWTRLPSCLLDPSRHLNLPLQDGPTTCSSVQ